MVTSLRMSDEFDVLSMAYLILSVFEGRTAPVQTFKMRAYPSTRLR
jgi:hypothetical protein